MGVPRRLADVALIADRNQGLLFGWAARRAKARGRAAEFLRRYDGTTPAP